MSKCNHSDGYFTEIQESVLERNIEPDGSIYCNIRPGDIRSRKYHCHDCGKTFNCNKKSPKWLKKLEQIAYNY